MQDISQEMFSITHYMYVFSHGMEEKDEWKKTEGGTKVTMFYPDLKTRDRCTPTTGPIDASHWG